MSDGVVGGLVGGALGEPVRALDRVGGGCICPAFRVTTGEGRVVFAKTHPEPPPRFFAAEAEGLRWLAEAVPGLVPDVLAVTESLLVLEWVDGVTPSAGAAEALGRDLAALHRFGADGFGAPWQGYVGSLPLDNRPVDSRSEGDWPAFYAARRLQPFLRLATDRGAIGARDRRAVEAVMDRLPALAGDPEPVARLHGDLWSGNLLWEPEGARLVDPAAHGGHRETDLAMLALFGAPHLDRLIAAYDEAYPLAAGWRERVGLHQLHPLLVHAALFGSGYGEQVGRVARRALAGA